MSTYTSQVWEEFPIPTDFKKLLLQVELLLQHLTAQSYIKASLPQLESFDTPLAL